MRSKAPLALMELTVMVLVFALAAVLCLRAFAWSDIRSRWNDDRDQAVLAAQSAAETWKAAHGDAALAADRYGGFVEQGLWTVLYDADWMPLSGRDRSCAAYEANLLGQSDDGTLRTAAVDVYREDNSEPLFSLTVACQREVAP